MGLRPVRALLSRCAFQESLSFRPVREVVLLTAWKVKEQGPGRSLGYSGTVELQSGLSAEACLLMPDAGPCRAAFPMFFYDPSTDTCQSFIYGGCHGNGNRYSSREDCMERCSFDGKCCSTHSRGQQMETVQ